MEDKLYKYLLESYKAEAQTIANDIFEEIPDIIDWPEESIQGKEQFVKESLLETEFAVMDNNSAVTFLEDFFVEEDIPKAEQKQYTKDSVLRMNKKVLQDKELINKIIKEIDKLFDYRIAKSNNRILKRIYAEDLNESDLNTEHYKRRILGYITIIEDYLSKIKKNINENDLIQCAITSYDVEYNAKKFAQVCNEIADKLEKEQNRIKN